MAKKYDLLLLQILYVLNLLFHCMRPAKVLYTFRA